MGPFLPGDVTAEVQCAHPAPGPGARDGWPGQPLRFLPHVAFVAALPRLFSDPNSNPSSTLKPCLGQATCVPRPLPEGFAATPGGAASLSACPGSADLDCPSARSGPAFSARMSSERCLGVTSPCAGGTRRTARASWPLGHPQALTEDPRHGRRCQSEWDKLGFYLHGPGKSRWTQEAAVQTRKGIPLCKRVMPGAARRTVTGR